MKQTVKIRRRNTRALLRAKAWQKKARNIVKPILLFITNKRGLPERAFEEVITNKPISAKHNPSHGRGGLNGNDIERLLESVEWIFSTLKSFPTSSSALSKEISKIEEVWDLFARNVPLIRSTILLEVTYRVDLLAYIKEFGELFTNNTTNNPMPKMHALFSHCEYYLKIYGTIGLFAEDALEVIHAFVNRVFGAFQSLDGYIQTKQLLQFLWSESDRAMKRQQKEIQKKDDKLAQGKQTK
jgi:hypothetical protein